MRTPIDDFVRAYAASDRLRMHMPGHKGAGDVEAFDLTEVQGADSLYEAEGIIRESEENASTLFGAHTFYSAEGSSLCIRAMLYLAQLWAAREGKPLRVAAGRNAHKTFLSAVALLGAEVDWLSPPGESYLACPLTAEYVKTWLREHSATALYLTSPDYLGNTVDVGAIATVCRKHGVLLLVDNAHGAYLKFLPVSRHPMDLGADLCCDSAHKTLPALTGAAYLHVSKAAPDTLRTHAKAAMALFGSTSPSYLILASLDRVNRYLSEGYGERLAAFGAQKAALEEALVSHGFVTAGNEPLKLTVLPKSYGYTGTELAEYLRGRGIEPEFCDPDYLVLMLSPERSADLAPLRAALLSLPRKAPRSTQPPRLVALPQAVLTPRDAILSPDEYLPAEACVGRVLASLTVGCPPAVPILVSGERIKPEHLPLFAYYGVTHLRVVKA